MPSKVLRHSVRARVYVGSWLGLIILLGIPGSATGAIPPHPVIAVASTAGSPPLNYSVGNITLGPPGASPSSVTFDPQTDDVYASTQPSYIQVVSPRNDSRVTTVNVGVPLYPGLAALAADPAAGMILAATSTDSVLALSAVNLSVVREIPASDPRNVLYVPITNQVFIAKYAGNEITVLNGTTLAQEGSISIVFPSALSFNPSTRELDVAGSYGFTGSDYVSAYWDSNFTNAWVVLPTELTTPPQSITYDSTDGDIYVPGYSANEVLVLDGTNGASVATVPSVSSPYEASTASRSNTVFVASAGSDAVAAIDGTTFATRSIAVGGYPEGVAYGATVNEVFVTNYDSDTLSILDATNLTVLSTVPMGLAPLGLSYVPSLGTLYSVGGTSLEANNLTCGTQAVVTVGQNPQSIGYDPLTGSLYVSNLDDGTISVVSAATLHVTDTLHVTGSPIGVVYDSASQVILVTLGSANSLAVLSATNGTVLKTIPVGSFPAGVVLDPVRNEAFVTNYYAGTISAVSMSTFQVVGTVTLAPSSGPGEPALDPANGELFVPNFAGTEVSVVSESTLTVTQNITVGVYPFAAVYDPVTGLVYVTNSVTGNMSVIDPANNSVIGSLPLGELPGGITDNPVDGTIYAANTESDNITYYSLTSHRPTLCPSAGGSSPIFPIAWIFAGSLIVGMASVVYVVWRSRRENPNKEGREVRERQDLSRSTANIRPYFYRPAHALHGGMSVASDS